MKNICIGKDAGMHLTDQSNQLCIKCDELKIDIIETITEREYELISKAVDVILFYNDKDKFPIFHGGCVACRSGNCSIHYGYNASKNEIKGVKS